MEKIHYPSLADLNKFKVSPLLEEAREMGNINKFKVSPLLEEAREMGNINFVRRYAV